MIVSDLGVTTIIWRKSNDVELCAVPKRIGGGGGASLENNSCLSNEGKGVQGYGSLSKLSQSIFLKVFLEKTANNKC